MSDAKRSAVNEWFDRTLYSRLDDKREDVIIVIMQRLHVDDLVVTYCCERNRGCISNSRLLPTSNSAFQSDRGEHPCARRENSCTVARTERSARRYQMGGSSFNFSAQYQQCPVPLEGEILKWEWFLFYDELPPRTTDDRIVQSWDTASKAEEINDFSACTMWLISGNDYYLIDVLREKLRYPDLKRRIIDHALRFGANSIIIENKGSGIALIQELQRETADVPHPIAFNPEGEKVTRMHAQSAKIEAGQVHLPRRAEWLGEFRLELLQFPRGRHDDQVDSLSQFLAWLERRNRNQLRVYPLEI